MEKESLTLATPMSRLGASILDAILFLMTLGIGWIIWSAVVWAKGTTPAHSILKQFVVDESTGKTFTWGRMFLREFVIKFLLTWVLGLVLFGIYGIVDSLFIIQKSRQTIHDRICSSIVVQR